MSYELQRNVSVLLGRIVQLLVLQLSEGTNDAEASIAWFDNVINVTVAGSIVGVSEELVVLLFLLLDEGLSLVHLTLFFQGLGFLSIEDRSCRKRLRQRLSS